MDENKEKIKIIDGMIYKKKRNGFLIKENKTQRLVLLECNNQTVFSLLWMGFDKKEEAKNGLNSERISLKDFFEGDSVSAIINKNSQLIDLRKVTDKKFIQTEPEKYDNFSKKLEFLEFFSKKEFEINGHEKKETVVLISVFDVFLPFIKNGKFLDIGCCTGITTKYVMTFSKCKIVPFGVDINERSITIAKKNLFKYKNNFKVLSFEKIEGSFLNLFSTVMLSIRFEINKKKGVATLNRLLDFLFKNKNNFKKEANIIILFENLFLLNEGINFFLDEIEKDFEILFLRSSIIVIKRKEEIRSAN